MTATERLQERYEAALMPNYGIPPLALARGQGYSEAGKSGK